MSRFQTCGPIKWYDQCLLSRGFAVKSNYSLHVLLQLRVHPPPANINFAAASTRQQNRHQHRHYRNINHSIVLREISLKSSSSLLKSSQAPRRLRTFGYLLTATLTFLSLNSFAIYTHYHDEIFHSYYPFPIAFDVGHGPSMLPTIGSGVDGKDNNLYLRDCWSHRFLWFDYEHCKKCIQSILSSLLSLYSHNHDTEKELEEYDSGNQISVVSSSSLFNRPWQKGDIVTLYNPHTKSLVTKRIIGVGGDYVCALGEYAREIYHQQHQHHGHETDADDGALDDYNGVGSVVVPHDTRFPIPFCQMIPSPSGPSRASQYNLMRDIDSNHQNQQQEKPQWYKNSIIQVPPHHVWLEGDNPFHSTDSRHYGPIPVSAIRGRIVMRIWPLGTEPILGSNRPPLPPLSKSTKTKNE